MVGRTTLRARLPAVVIVIGEMRQNTRFPQPQRILIGGVVLNPALKAFDNNFACCKENGDWSQRSQIRSVVNTAKLLGPQIGQCSGVAQ